MVDRAQETGLTLRAPQPLRPSAILRDRRFVVVGGTGFLGKVWVSMFLHDFPEIGHIYLLVRPKGDQSPEERFWADIVPNGAFDPLRELYPGRDLERFLSEKVTPIAGDITEPLLGFSPELLESMKGSIAAVVNVAGVVDFNPPLDEALKVNAFGVNNLIELARALGASLLHTSTCYVAGYRTGFIDEVDPRDVPFPRAQGAAGSRLIAPPEGIPLDRKLDRSHWDPQNEINECLDVIQHTLHRCEDAFRQSLFLDEAKKNLEERGEPGRGAVLEGELATVKRKFVRDRLVNAGLERALYWGWPNIYTYTKSIGEQVLAASGVPYTIVRPAVVESSCRYPCPGWNEGINTSAPYIYMSLKGQVQLPTDPDVHLDLIPVDMVCSGMIAALTELCEGTQKPVYQMASTDTNPCKVARFVELIGLYKRKKLQDGGDEGNMLMNAVLARFEPVGLSKKQYQTHGAHAIARAARGAAGLLENVGIGPLASYLRPAAKVIRKAAEREDKLGDLIDMFLPFVAECDWVFSCQNTRSALARMPADEQARFFWEPEKIDWRDWMFEIHMPGIERWSVPEFERRLQRELKPLRRYETLLDLLDEMAERHEHAVALRYLEKDGLSRITFLEWREASASVAGRLSIVGVKSGDRVLLAGKNRPAWPIAYFGILRAGAVAVPVDPEITPAQLRNIARGSGARIAILGSEVSARADVDVLDLDEVTTDDRSLAVPEVSVRPSDLASIIYTSGTTGDPKGVMLTHDNFAALLAAITPLFSLGPRDGVLSVLPLHHTFEFSCGLLLPMSRGATISYIGEVNSDRLADVLRQARITGMVGVPALWQMLERKVLSEVREKGPLAARAFDWGLALNRMLGKKAGVDAGRLFFGAVHDRFGGHIKYLISGGSALPKSTADTFAGLGLKLTEGYGLTEAAPVLTVAPATPRSRVGQVGKPIPGVEIRIENPDKDGVGEVLARGPNVMRGYFENDDATRATVDDEGWLHTGDRGKLDERGQLVISGRDKDVIVSVTGENVYPDDVENMLGQVPHVDELAIVGLKREDTELVGCIAVPLLAKGEDRATAHARALQALKDRIATLPRYCQPTVVQLYDAELPKTVTRKVKRREVQRILERLMVASLPPPADASDAAPAMVQRAVAAIAGRRPEEIGTNMSLAGDLGFDSLMAMELTMALEAQLGSTLDAEELNRIETIEDLVRLVRRGGRRSATAIIERVEDKPVDIPAPVAGAAKRLLTSAQMGFYDRVMKPTIYGSAFIPHNRNTIVVSNHSSHLDMGFVKYALGSYGQDIVGLAAADYFFEGRWRKAYFEQLTNLQAFDRKTNLRQALREAADTIRAGRTMLLFPEGTRSKDGTVHEFKSTLGHLALTTGVDILPVHIGGTYESWPKGRRFPTRRDITARIGPPLAIVELERLTSGMKFAVACRAVSSIARAAVIALSRGTVLELAEIDTLDEALGQKKEHPLVELFRDLERRYVAGKVERSITYYFSLGAEAEAKWTATLEPDRCHIEIGKPADNNADCVLKTSADLFTKMIRESYMPSPVEIMSGQVKSNDVSLLATFQQAFDLR
ncbi:MAG TPA: AMP-binding protein [Polyangiaceae bacterium]|nr:AMP-binding protein [Polyangiaceae bacterium]